MREKNTIIICTIVCITLIICGILFWPTLYRYDKIKLGDDTFPFRVNRITGYTEILWVNDGWRAVRAEKVIKTMHHEEMAKITRIGDFDGKGHYKFDIYNGTVWTIRKIRLSIGLKDNQGKDKWQRIYETSVNIQPFSKSSSSIELMDYAPRTFYEPYVPEPEKGKWVIHDALPVKDFIPDIRIEKIFGYQGE